MYLPFEIYFQIEFFENLKSKPQILILIERLLEQ